MQEKIRIPEPSELLNQLLSPTDIENLKLKGMQTLAESNIDDLKKEFERRERLDGIKDALENEDYDLLHEIYREMYGEDMVSAGKQLIISYLALKGVRVKDETHIAETVGQWILAIYEEAGLNGLYDWATNIDVAMQVIKEYQVVFDSEIAKQSKKNKTQVFTRPLKEMEWSVITGESLEDDDDDYNDEEDYVDTSYDLNDNEEDISDDIDFSDLWDDDDDNETFDLLDEQEEEERIDFESVDF